jgi:hypothetical protein
MGDPHIGGHAQGSTAMDLGRLAPVIPRATQSTVEYWSAAAHPICQIRAPVAELG